MKPLVELDFSDIRINPYSDVIKFIPAATLCPIKFKEDLYKGSECCMKFGHNGPHAVTSGNFLFTLWYTGSDQL